MNNEQTSPNPSASVLTQHAMLVVWGIYARHIGLVKKLMAVKLQQKRREHRPQTKVLEFLVSILAGLSHLDDISLSAHPLDQDQATADAWEQPAWADHSGVSRTLQSLDEPETTKLMDVTNEIEQPIIDQEVQLALERSGRLVYDADLTGRPVSNTSTSYPGAAYGYMGDTVSLGYQAALVTLHSPTYGRLWLSNRLHPGDTVSSSEAQAMVQAAEARTQVRPLRRTALLQQRLAQVEQEWLQAQDHCAKSYDKQRAAEAKVKDTSLTLTEWQQKVRELEAEYQRGGRQPTAHCPLSRAKRKVTSFQNRLPRVQQILARDQRRRLRHDRVAQVLCTQVEQLRTHLTLLAEENRTNLAPIQAVFRLDGGFASQENITWLIEMGYDLYTKSRSPKMRELLGQAVCDQSQWQRVGRNASLMAWPNTTVEGQLTYPMNVALAHYQTGDAQRQTVLLHYGQESVTDNLSEWFHMYNRRQIIEAGIKEGKGVFQMHHLKVRSAQALRLQEHFACFSANFVRFAAHWLSNQASYPPTMQTDSVKHMVEVSAHTSAWVRKDGDDWMLTFTEQSLYAGHSLHLGNGPVQLPLPFGYRIQNFHF
jgi:hypothetical protein